MYMAATDQFYRNQKTLDLVFGVSSVLMLVSLLVMFYQDQKKEWKDEQRLARDVEEAMAQRSLLYNFPDADKLKAAHDAVDAAQKALGTDEQKAKLKTLENELADRLAAKVRGEADYLDRKAFYDSNMSLLAIATEHRNKADEAHRKAHETEVEGLTKKVADLKALMDAEQRKFQAAEKAYDDKKKELDDLKKPLTEATAELKRLNTEFDRIAKLVSQKRWGLGDSFRTLPVIDAFNSPTRIHQFVLEDLPIEYGSFKYVTRYDRCMSCHIAIDRPAYTPEALAALKETPSDLVEKLKNAQAALNQRYELLQDKKEKKLVDFDLGSLRSLPNLTARHISEFKAHPRLDLFVDDNSPHGKEKFGCSICHSGQGSATSFNLAAHTPNNSKTTDKWVEDYHWASQHYWDFPMLPHRFIESSCVKCHHQITDLIRDGSKNEAPKLVHGYNLVRDNGCFGCHEISSLKGGRTVGPDMRLEPWPALDALTPAEKLKATSDPLNPAGTMRKVGPSLRRLSEKTNDEWVRKWIKDPRGFRPDTKMPHFYGLSNHSAEALKGTGQENFPDAEIHAVTHYLMQASRDYLAGTDSYRVGLEARQKALAEKTKRTDAETRELDDLKRKLELYPKPTPIAKTLTLDGGATVAMPEADKDAAAQQARGRALFSERGCLACHSHQGTESTGQNLPAITGNAQFGPNLSRMAAKLGSDANDKESARRWLVQWILNPNLHHPRTFMPVTHLDANQAADIAAWILAQNPEWNVEDVPPPSEETLKALARVWLEKSRSLAEVDDLLSGKNPGLLDAVSPQSDESYLKGGLTVDKLKMYVGKKAVANMGCFACHDIPGMEAAKPIGTALNDWGKKDGDKLAFEDIGAFIKKHYEPVQDLNDYKGSGKAPYEQFFLNEIDHHSRIGFLHQKLREPRSYDHDRVRKWDERLRMPQFKFARVDRKPGESEEAFAKRSEQAEAEGREAVMTFILGLVAEPIPAKYLHNPAPDRKAEVIGRQVLDKFNCAGCHLVRPGVYEFKKTENVVKTLDRAYKASETARAAELSFGHHGHTAWAARPVAQQDRIVARAVPTATQPDDKTYYIRLTEGLRYQSLENQPREILAGFNLGIGDEDILPSEVLTHGKTYGGTYAYLMVPYLKSRAGKDTSDALASLPPPLLRQGEKTQPDWLFRFLKNPTAIRPLAILRMPKFNMSEEEATALVNYFASADKIGNPSEGIIYPYAAVQQRDDSFWQSKSRDYVARLKQNNEYDKRVTELKPIWEQQVKEENVQLDQRLAAAQLALKEAKEESAKKSIQQTLEDLKQQRASITPEAKQREWEDRYAYAADAYRMVANYNNICLSCHRVGNMPAKEEKGPALDLVWERLRPQWTEKWVANPVRMMSPYVSVMQANFQKSDADPKGHGKVFPQLLGTPMEQATAARDLLLNFPRISELPVNRLYKPAQPAGGGK